MHWLLTLFCFIFQVHEVRVDMENVWLEFMMCSVCWDYIEPPVTEICTNGHNGCSTCVKHLTKCPICELPADPCRNIGIETKCRNAMVRIPCNNSFLGCNKKSLIDDMKNHSEICLYQWNECPFAQPRANCCSWKGPIIALQQHILQRHHDCKLIISHEEIINLSYSCITENLVIMRNHEIFLVKACFSKTNLLKYYCISVEYVGPKKNIPDYKYEIKVDGGCNQEIQFGNDSDITDPENIKKSGLHVHVRTHRYICVPIHKRKYHITISRSLTTDGHVDTENALYNI